MHLVKLKALRPLRGDYEISGNTLVARSVHEGDVFVTDNENADRLEAAGLAERHIVRPSAQPRPAFSVTVIQPSPEKKIVAPAENKVTTPEIPAADSASSAPKKKWSRRR